MDLIFYILLASIIISFSFFIKEVFFVKRKSSSFKIFIYFNLLLGLIISGPFLYTFDLGYNTNFINFYTLLFFVLCICLAPTWYLYIKSLTRSVAHESSIIDKAKHYYPAFTLGVVNIFAFVYLNIKDEGEGFYDYIENVMTYANLIALYFVFLFQILLYVFLSIVLYRKHTKSIADLYSFKEGISLNWFLGSIVGFIIFIAAIYVVQIGIPKGDIFLGLAIIAYLFFININAIKQEFTFNKMSIVNYEKLVDFKESSKIEQSSATRSFKSNSTIETDTSESMIKSSDQNTGNEVSLETNHKNSWFPELVEKITLAMHVEKVYLDKNLSLFQLSNHIDSNTKYVSYTINNEFNKNFSSFINEYRINEAVHLLSQKESEQYTLEYIAQQVGFKSRSSFISAFKKVKEMTPSQYKSTLV